MNALINYLKKDKIIGFSILASCSILLLSLFYIIFVYRYLPNFLPLYNQMPWGAARLGDKWQLFIVPIAAFFVVILNALLINILYNKVPLLARMLGVTTLLLTLITIIFIFRMTQLII